MTYESFYEGLYKLLEIVSIDTESAYSFMGKKYDISSELSAEDIKSRTSNFIITHLTNLFYKILHCKQTVDYKPLLYDNDVSENRDFLESLSNENKGRGFWEDGWTIGEITDEGNISIQKNDLTLWINNRKLLFGSRFRKDQLVKVFMPKEFRFMLPGFYTVNGNKSLNYKSTILRIYWNIRSSGAHYLVRLISTHLNKNNIPFQFKIINSIPNFNRTDSAVLYTNRKDFDSILRILRDIYKRIRPFLKDETSVFSKKLFFGMSFGENPDTHESFGLNRSRILAEACYKIFEDNITSKYEKVHTISKHFNFYKIDVHRPYAYLGSVNYYDSKIKGNLFK